MLRCPQIWTATDKSRSNTEHRSLYYFVIFTGISLLKHTNRKMPSFSASCIERLKCLEISKSLEKSSRAAVIDFVAALFAKNPTLLNTARLSETVRD